MTGDLIWEKMTDEKSKERSCDETFLVANIGILLILRPINSQTMFVFEVSVETVSDYIKKKIITTRPLPLIS